MAAPMQAPGNLRAATPGRPYEGTRIATAPVGPRNDRQRWGARRVSHLPLSLRGGEADAAIRPLQAVKKPGRASAHPGLLFTLIPSDPAFIFALDGLSRRRHIEISFRTQCTIPASHRQGPVPACHGCETAVGAARCGRPCARTRESPGGHAGPPLRRDKDCHGPCGASQ